MAGCNHLSEEAVNVRSASACTSALGRLFSQEMSTICVQSRTMFVIFYPDFNDTLSDPNKSNDRLCGLVPRGY